MFCTDTISVGVLDLIDADLGQPDVSDLALVLQGQQLAHLVGQRELVIDAVQLEQVDGVDAEPAQAHLAFLTQVTRITQRDPDVGAGAQQSRLGRDHQPVIRVQRLADDLLGYVGAVGIGGVDEVHPEFGGSPQDPDAFVAVGGRAPYPLTGQPHGAEPEPVDGEVAAEGERSGCLGYSL